MNFNLFSVIAASAVSATAALPVHAAAPVSPYTSNVATYTQSYLQKSATFYAALNHKIQG